MRHCTNKTNQSSDITIASSSPSVHLFFLTKSCLCLTKLCKALLSRQNRQTTKRKASFSVDNSHCRLLWSAHESRLWLPRGLPANTNPRPLEGLREGEIETFLDIHCECSAIVLSSTAHCRDRSLNQNKLTSAWKTRPRRTQLIAMRRSWRE